MSSLAYRSDEYHQAIAIIGMSGCFPKSKNLTVFWENIKQGKDLLSRFSDDELRKAGVIEKNITDPCYVKTRGVLDDIEYFDASLFRLSPYEASIMDPQQRIFIEKCWEALEVSGYCISNNNLNVGVFGAVADNFYWQRLLRSSENFSENSEYQFAIASSPHFLATRVAYLLDLKGMSMTVSTACSSSLVAVTTACQALLRGDCDMALAGGVSLKLPQIRGYFYKEGNIFSKDGYCRPFDASASGTVSGAGVGVVILKRLEDALAANDSIDVIIRDFCVNNDGAAKAGYTAPSIIEQARCIASALSATDPETIAYLEAHGTGTYLGDPIELEALTKAYRHYTNKLSYCALGSVKANIGHADTASGVASLIKTALVLKNRQIPPLAHFKTPNRGCFFAESPFYINTRLQSLKKSAFPARAGVNSLGIGGTNAHVVLEAYQQKARFRVARSSQMLLHSANSASVLELQRKNIIDEVASCKAKNFLADAAFTLAVGRKALTYRSALLLIDGKQSSIKTVHAKLNVNNIKKTVFMFPGQDAFKTGFFAELYQQEACVKAMIDEYLMLISDKVLQVKFFELLTIKKKECCETLLQPVLFLIEFFVAKLLIFWGITPDAMIGHSLGEYVAACLAGVIKFEEVVNLLVFRQELSQRLPAGAMWAVALPYDEINQLAIDSGVSIAAINSPKQTVVSGSEKELRIFEKMLRDRFTDSVTILPLKSKQAFHSEHIRLITADFEKKLATIEFKKAIIPYVANLTGKWIEPDELSSQYFINHMKKPVCFSQGITRLLSEGFNFFIEISPYRKLSNLLKQHNSDVDIVTVSAAANKKFDLLLSGLQEVLATAWVNGIPINMDSYYQHEKRARVPLPTYPFNKKKYWVNADHLENEIRISEGKSNKISFYREYWEFSPNVINKADKPDAALWLIFDDGTNVSDNLINSAINHNISIIRVFSNKNFPKKDNSFYINIKDANSYKDFFITLSRKKLFPQYIFYCWSLLDDNFEYQHFVALSQVVKFCFEFSANCLKKLFIFTRQAFKINDGEKINFSAALLPGLITVIEQEYLVKIRLIDVGCQTEIYCLFFQEFNNNSDEQFVAYRDNYRFTKSYRNILLPQQNLTGTLKIQGTYLITGGLGGMGLIIAEYLAENYQAKLILLTRHKRPNIESRLSTLRKNASSLEICYIDITNDQNFIEMFARLKGRYNLLDGIFHCAGVMKKSLIKKFDFPNTLDIMAVKVAGTKNILKIVEYYHPNICVLASSIASVLGGVGMSAYAAANGFLDTYSNFQQSQKTRWISINWDELNFNLSYRGIKTLEKLDILNVLKSVLGSSHILNRIIVSVGDLQNRIREITKENAVDKNYSLKKPISYHQEQLLEIIKDCTDVKKMLVTDSFYECGVSSLMALEIISKINTVAGIKITLADFMRADNVKSLFEKLQSKNKSALSNNMIMLNTAKQEQHNLFLIHPLGGSVFCYQELAKHLCGVLTCYGIQDAAIDGSGCCYDSIKDMASGYIKMIKAVQAKGTYYLGGYSFGGVLAFEVARQLIDQGDQVNDLMLIDSWAILSDELKSHSRFLQARDRIKNKIENTLHYNVKRKELLLEIQWKRMQLLFDYSINKLSVNLTLIKAEKLLPEYQSIENSLNHWGKFTSKKISLLTLPENHETILNKVASIKIADFFKERNLLLN